jgi:hypothetical protein
MLIFSSKSHNFDELKSSETRVFDVVSLLRSTYITARVS